MRERKTRRNKHRFNKTVAKRVLLNKRFQDLHPEVAQQQPTSQVLPRVVDIKSDSSGISSSDYSTTRSAQSQSTEGSITPELYTPDGSPSEPSTPKGGYKSRKRRVYRKRHTMRKKAQKKRR
jgi:hypothetical protein